MAIIPQRRLFGWDQIEGLGDLERLRLVIEYMPDEVLMRRALNPEVLRKNGKNFFSDPANADVHYVFRVSF